METFKALGMIPEKEPRSRSNIACCSFDITWDPAQFLVDQFEVPTEASLCNVITVTGSREGLQAATCLEYVQQTWPVTGEETLFGLQDYVRNKLLRPSSSIPPLSGEFFHNFIRFESSAFHLEFCCSQHLSVAVSHQ